VAARAKTGSGIRRAGTGTKAPKATDILDDGDGDDSDDDDDSGDDGDGDDSDDGDEDEDDSDSGDDSDDDDTDPETEFLAGLTEEQAKFYNDSATSLRAKLTKANANARKHRLARAALQGAGAGTGAGTGAQPPKPGSTKKDAPLDQAALLAQLRTEMAAEEAAKELTRSAADALVEAGLVLPTDKAARRRALSKAVRMLELDGADVDDLDEIVDDLKAEMPGLFKAARRKPTAGVGGPKKATGSKSSLGTEIDKLFG
jgi:hypothetical protein